MTRLRLIKRAVSLIFGSLLGLAYAAPASAMGSREVWAQSLDALDAEQAKTLLQWTRDTWPDDELSDALYMDCVDPLERAARKDGAWRSTLIEGLATLDKAAQGMGALGYRDLAPLSRRQEASRELLDTPMMQRLRDEVGPCITAGARVRSRSR